MPDTKNTDKDYWKETILAINDAKILSYIQELCRARLDIGNADKRAEGEEPYNSYGYAIPSSPEKDKDDEDDDEEDEKLEPIMKMKTEKEEDEGY